MGSWGSGQWAVGSGQWAVGRGQWALAHRLRTRAQQARDQLRHLKDLQKLATEKQFACDKDIRTHVDLLPDEYKPEVKDARPNLLAETTFHAALLADRLTHARASTEGASSKSAAACMQSTGDPSPMRNDTSPGGSPEPQPPEPQPPEPQPPELDTLEA